MDQILLEALYAAQPESVSLAEMMSRTKSPAGLVSQRIAALREIGYGIEAHPQLGYRLTESPDSLMSEDLQARMAAGFSGRTGNYIGNRILTFECTSSTNDVVQRLALEGHPEGLAVFADSQTAGRGRLGRKWVSPKGKGLWFTVLLRPRFPVQSAARLTVMAAVAVATSLRRTTELPLTIKWPNDILCRGRKVAGILLEMDAAREEIQHVSLGIGIDVNQEREDFPEWLQSIATSLKWEAKKGSEDFEVRRKNADAGILNSQFPNPNSTGFHRPTLAIDLLQELEACSKRLSDESFPGLLERWTELDQTLGRQISVEVGNGQQIRGFALDLDPDGALRVRTDAGRIERVDAGELRIEN